MQLFFCVFPSHDQGGVKGMGLKAPDTETMPLCQRCHMAIHQDYNLFDQQKAVEETRKKIIAFNYISPLDF